MPRESMMQGVSFKPKLLKNAKKRAEELGLGFSAYIQILVRNDLKRKKDFVIILEEEELEIPNKQKSKKQ